MSSLRVLILSLNYGPEPTGFAPHSTALAEHLVAVGHEVTVVTGFPFAPRWERFAEYKGEWTRREVINGVRVVRISHFVPKVPRRLFDRLLMEGSFATLAGLILLPSIIFGSRFDAVVYIGAQPAIAWLGRAAARLCGASFIVKVTDLAAQASLDVGIVRSKLLARLLEHVEFSAYTAAQAAIVLCDAFRESFVRHGFSGDSVHVIPSPVDVDSIRPGGSGDLFRERFGIAKGEFVVLYSGSLGLKQNLADVVAAAKLVGGEYPDVRWVLVGEGETRQALAKQIETAQIADRILLLPLQPEAEMNQMFAAADVLLLSQLRAVKETVIPSKLLTYMAAGRPILAAVNATSQGAKIVRDADCGLLIEPQCPTAFSEAIRRLRTMPEERDAMARRGRLYAERHFDRKTVISAQQRLIEQSARSPRS